MKTSKQAVITLEDLTVKLIKGKYGEYMYKSPRYGYKRAHKYNQIIYIYLTVNYPYNGWIDTHCFKFAKRQTILDYLKEFKTTRKYLKAISGLTTNNK